MASLFPIAPYDARFDQWLPANARPYWRTVTDFRVYYRPFGKAEHQGPPSLNPEAVMHWKVAQTICRRWPGLCESDEEFPLATRDGGHCAACIRELF